MNEIDFHPAVAAWFRAAFGTATACQRLAWPAIQSGHHALVVAPTGSGKTLAAFLGFLDRLARQAAAGELQAATQVLYVSPLKALSNDIQKNLQQPLEGIQRSMFEAGTLTAPIEVAVRTGDTSMEMRRAMIRRHPHILVTTPESLYILLTTGTGRRMLQAVRSVIVDEIHALVGNKRGAHLALSVERLEQLVGGPLQRVGLSATQKPLAEVARFLLGAGNAAANCQIIDASYARRFDFATETPALPLSAVMTTEVAKQIYDRIAELSACHRTTLVFVNTRRMAERVALALTERIGAQHVTSHHGSLSRAQRLSAEQRLKHGQLRVLVATSSLELGIDIGEVELVCQLGSPAAISAWLQRVGRSGHYRGGVPKGRLFPCTRDDLVECLALLDAVAAGALETLCVPDAPLDVLAQQLVAMAACEDWPEQQLYAIVRRAWPYRSLSPATFDAVLGSLADGFSSQRGRRAAHLLRDPLLGQVKGRKGARLAAITNGGAIPDAADYAVVLQPQEEPLGSVDEHFAMETVPGDIFQLGNRSWKVLRVEQGRLHVEDAGNTPPTLPFWFGEAPGRSHALSEAVAKLRRRVADRLATNQPPASIAAWLAGIGTVDPAAQGTAEYLATAYQALGGLPTERLVIFERFFDETGGTHLVIHSSFGTRVNRAWGLALRKRFCRTFNFELQAAATDDAVILSLGAGQSFGLDEVPRFLKAATVRPLLTQALLASPLFTTRWRWVCTTALAVARFRNGKKVPPHVVRMQAEDLVTQVFPDQLACLENIQGDRHIPDHPLVQQAVADCLYEAMDIEAFEAVLAGIENGTIQTLCRDLTAPSPLAAEILAARAYAFLDGAPMEERRTRAVQARRWLPEQAAELAALDPAAIAQVRDEAWPSAATADDLYDALCVVGAVRAEVEVPGAWQRAFADLCAQQRAATWSTERGGTLWLAAELWPLAGALYPLPAGLPVQRLPPVLRDQRWSRADALTELLRRRLSWCGPATAGELAEALALPAGEVAAAGAQLESEGYVLRGRFRAGGVEEWCERRLLARIHRLTVQRLRAEVEPVTADVFVRFLLRWQHVHPDARLRGEEALPAVLELLEGYAAPAAVWERELLSIRCADYDPVWLDRLCQSGRFVWARLARRCDAGRLKRTPISFVPRQRLGIWRNLPVDPPILDCGAAAARVFEVLQTHGAMFFDELGKLLGLPPKWLEDALAALISAGWVTGDSFQGMRVLMAPGHRRRRYAMTHDRLDTSGRWSLLDRGVAEDTALRDAQWVELVARTLLRRYGVVFRALLEQETHVPAWPVLAAQYRRMEARGELRGGRFVAGQRFEQYALPEAVEALRAAREAVDDTVLAVHAADPLNLTGMAGRVAVSGAIDARVVWHAGRQVGQVEGANVQWLVAIEPAQQGQWEHALRRHWAPIPSRLYG